MQRIAEFHKVSFKRFFLDSKECGFIDDDTPEDLIRIVWDKIKIPQRATNGSAGYDFYLPYPFSINPGKHIIIPTGICAEIQQGWMLMLLPRSGLGFKYGLRFENTAGVIDADYFFAENEGHIKAKISTESNMCLNDGERFMQGIFFPYGMTMTDDTEGIRTGGFGSTGA